VGGKGGGGGRGEKWTKPCMHIWIIKEKWKKKRPKENNKTYVVPTASILFWIVCEDWLTVMLLL
jgi:hypothetical protein